MLTMFAFNTLLLSAPKLSYIFCGKLKHLYCVMTLFTLNNNLCL